MNPAARDDNASGPEDASGPLTFIWREAVEEWCLRQGGELPRRPLPPRHHRWPAVLSGAVLSAFTIVALLAGFMLHIDRPGLHGAGLPTLMLLHGLICATALVMFLYLLPQARARFFLAWSCAFMASLALGALAVSTLLRFNAETAFDIGIGILTGYGWGCLLGLALRTFWKRTSRHA